MAPRRPPSRCSSASACRTCSTTPSSRCCRRSIPLIKESFALDYGQIGLITFTFQLTASLLQPFVGVYTDRHPQPYSLPIGMGASFVGLLLLSVAPTYGVILLAAGLVGTGSSVFHPEASRLARLASGGRHGFAQSIFQVGGNAGAALGPLLAAAIVVPHGREQHRLVLDPRADRHRRSVDGQRLVPAQPFRRDAQATHGGEPPARPDLSRARVVLVAGRARACCLLQVLLSGELPQLLHLLPDRPLSTCRCRRARSCSSSSCLPLPPAR